MHETGTAIDDMRKIIALEDGADDRWRGLFPALLSEKAHDPANRTKHQGHAMAGLLPLDEEVGR